MSQPDDDIYQTQTPFGPVAVTFPEEGGAVFDGNPAAVDHLRVVIGAQTDGQGCSMSVETLEPADFYYFCQPSGAGVTITPPPGAFDDNEDQSMLSMDDAGTPLPGLRAILRDPFKRVMDKVSAMASLLDLLAAAPHLPVDDVPLAPRNPSGQYYEFDPNRKQAQRKKDNAAAMALLGQIDAGAVDATRLTPSEKAVLAKYSGTGGALIGADGKKGSAYEYYTPAPIAAGIHSLLAELGFTGGKMLDPCAGTGIFGATAPQNTVVDAVELNATSGRVNALVNDGPGYTTTVSPFEAVAANTPDEVYDAVVTNVPFGGVADRGGNNLLDSRYQNEPLQNYFILRSLEKLKPGGLAAFITPPRCVSGKGGKEEDMRLRASYMAEFVGAYRLPNVVFGTAAADTMTDVMVFRKYGRETLDKIAELREQSPDTLIEANVQWQPFIEGKYFDDEGRRFVLGDLATAKNRFGGDMTILNSSLSVPEIAKLMRKFPDSRVDWKLLDTTETAPIIYRDGDTLTQAGVTLEMQDGRWVPLQRSEGNAELAQLAGKLKDPYSAFENNIGWTQAEQCVNHMIEMAQALDIPEWLRGAVNEISKLKDEGDRAQYWHAGVVGLAVEQVLSERLGEEIGVKYIDEYPALSEAMQRVANSAKSRPSAIGGAVRKGMATLCNHFQKKTGFSAIWRGDVLSEVKSDLVTADGTFEGLRYQSKSVWVEAEEAKAIFGEAFDPLDDAGWCVSADGRRVTRADDYYVGNYGEFLARIDAEIAQATDERVRAKLLRQKLDAVERIDRIDVSKLTFNLASPHVALEEKAEFLRRYVHESAAVVFDDKTGEKRLALDIPNTKEYENDRGKLLNRFTQYLKNGTITLGGAQTALPQADALRELRKMVNTANEQFNGWVRANQGIIKRLESVAGDPAKLRFKAVEDEAPLNVPGLNPDFKTHGYQNAEIRRQSREFGGVNGFDVGLGKTFTALTATQYAHSIGVKKKTAFVVPNSVLSNWRKEVGRAFVSTDDCLFVGLRINKTGKAVVSSSDYDEDLLKVLENRHSKIFMSMEAFERIRLRGETIDAYQNYLRRVDASFAESEDKKEDERNKGKQAGLLDVLKNKTGSAPFLEDMGIDSLVIDEAHAFKNSAEVVGFKSAKYLSLADSAARGTDAQAKAWYVREKSPMKDGVMLLTATPITNSPLEIYSMLSLAVGHERVNDMCLGIKGADDFMEMMCRKENEDDVTMDGVARTTDVFVGLNNVEVLRKAIGEVANIKSAEQVGEQIVVPDQDEKKTPITLPPAIVDRLKTYKQAFRYAIDEISGKKDNRGDLKAFEEVQAHFGEPMRLIGHPFNLINKMSLLIADPELDQRATFYLFPPNQLDKAQKAVEQFNAKKYSEDRSRPAPMTDVDAILSQKTKKDDDGNEATTLKIHVRAKIADHKIIIDTIIPETQAAFEAMAEKSGLDLDVTVPPKLAALLENFQQEQANPRGMDDEGNRLPIVKQIIFCDTLALHNKIRRLLVKRAGIPASAIAIITGKANNKPDEILAVQDGFNGHGEDNKYRVILANEKAEVGINLQKGTQAIHHLTIGWTPDSLAQRNGRGVRQGNKTARVNVYHYEADGTFDSSKRTMVDKKSDWIEQVMDVHGEGAIDVTGGLSNEQIEALIDTVGDADAVKRMQETLAAKEAEQRASSNRDRQMINVDTIQKQNEFLNKNTSAEEFAIRKVVGLWNLDRQAIMLRARIANPHATATAVAKNEALLAELQGSINGLRRLLDKSVVFYKREWRNGKNEESTASLDEFFSGMRQQRKQKPEDVEEHLRHGQYPMNIRVRAVENEAIFNDWQAEVDLAKSMIKEATGNFMRQAQTGGALPAAVVEAFASGKGLLFNGKPVIPTCFFRLPDGFLGVINARNTVTAMNKWGDKNTLLIDKAVKQGEIVYPGTSEYDACLTLAAEIEDAEAKAGRVTNDFTDVIPDVAQRRTQEVLARYNAFNYKLPSPYFPYVLTNGAATEVRKHLDAGQDKIIRRRENGYFTVPGSLAVEARRSSEPVHEALVEYAVAHGLKLVLDDFGAPVWVRSQIEKRVNVGDFNAALTGESEGEVMAAAGAAMRRMVPWFDFGTADPADADYLPYNCRKVLEDAVKQTVAAPSEAVESPTDVIGIKGNTKPWKETIKQCATVAGLGKYKWDGDALLWNVYRMTWEYLVKNYPKAAAELEITEGTRKLY